MPAYGVTPAGFVVKPLSAILADMQAQVLATINSEYDLSPATPDGQMLAIVASEAAPLWELAQIAWNQYNRQDVEGAGLDNLGDITGTPREGASYTQVYATLNLDPAHAPYPAGSLIANVQGNSSLTFSNKANVTGAMISGGVATGILMQAQTIGPTPTINPNTLTVITTSVTGWTGVTNPAAQSQLGTNAELDPQYAQRQAADVTAEGACNPSATAAAIEQLGAAQSPPQTLSCTMLENKTPSPQTISGITLPPHTYSAVIYDGGTGWAVGAGAQLIANTIYANKPSGITPIGNTPGIVADPILGNQPVAYDIPTGLPLYITMTVVARTGFDFTALSLAIRNALVQAAIAPSLPSGVPPNGQLAPGTPVVGSQLEVVIGGVPGVFDIQSLAFGFSPSPTNTAPLAVTGAQVATILAATVGINVVINPGTYP